MQHSICEFLSHDRIRCIDGSLLNCFGDGYVLIQLLIYTMNDFLPPEMATPTNTHGFTPATDEEASAALLVTVSAVKHTEKFNKTTLL